MLSVAPAAYGQADPSRQHPAGPSQASELARQYVADFMLRERLKAEGRLLAREIERLELAAQGGSPVRNLVEELAKVDLSTREALVGALQEGTQPLVDDLGLAAAQLQQRTEQLQAAWQSVRASLNQGQFLLFEVKGSRQVAGQFASLLSVDKRWFWLFGVVAIACLLGVVCHDRRHEIRRMLNGGRARAMRLSKFLLAALVILIVLAATTLVLGNRIYEWLLAAGSGQQPAPRQTMLSQNAALEREIASLQQARRELHERFRQAEAAWRASLAACTSGDATLALQCEEFRKGVGRAAAELALLESLPWAMDADLADLEKLNQELAAHSEATARYLRLKHWIRGGLGLALLGLAGAGGLFFRRGVVQRRKAAAQTCPLCLGRNCLEPEAEDPAAAGRSPPGFKAVKCRSVIRQQPREECDYTFAAAYRDMPKLCFPTLGVPQAGKTHWLAMIYWELNRGDYPRRVEFEKIKSRSSEEFDRIVEEILISRIGTAATQRERIPHPLVFNFRDRDPWSRSNLLVNIFDYSGEVTSDMGVDDYRRRRALEGDGYLFFLDPTFPGQPQAKALADFREDLRLVQAARSGRRIRTPMALCVSKIDLLAGQPYALPDGGDAIQRFYEDLARIDPTGEAMTLEVIEARSRLVARLRETIWPGWQIERQVDDLFGGQHLFFPLTPVGLDGRGETDLSLRTISPFGLLEPLVWLLQTSGYPILQ